MAGAWHFCVSVCSWIHCGVYIVRQHTTTFNCDTVQLHVVMASQGPVPKALAASNGNVKSRDITSASHLATLQVP